MMEEKIRNERKTRCGYYTVSYTHLDVYKRQVPEVAEDISVGVKLNYTMDKEEKTITIKADESEFEKLAKKSDGKYTQEDLKNALDSVTTTFDYSVDQEQLTLTEREYGEQMTFIKE